MTINALFGLNMKGDYMNINLLKELNSIDKDVLRIATNAIYFNDNSDYLSALWEIVNKISKDTIEDCNSELFDFLNYG